MSATGILSMPKALCIGGMIVSVLLLLVFGLDLVTGMLLERGFPFGGASMMMDLCFVICSAVLGYLSWTTLREQV